MAHFAAILRLSLLLFLTLSSCHVIFVSDAVTSIAVTPANPTIAVGATQQFTAHVTHRDGFTLRTTGVRWSTSSPAVATINSAGLARGISAGTAAITATLDDVSGSTTLTVTASAPAMVAVEGGAGKLELAFPASAQRLLYVANPLEDTLSVYRVDPATGAEQLVGEFSVYPGHGPAWLAVHPHGKFLYVLNRLSEDISTFSIDPATGDLMPVVGSPFPCGTKPWTIVLNSTGEFLEVTPIGSAEITRFRIEPYTGALTLSVENK